MASDSSEPARRRHHRSSVHEDADEHSKRRKHRHHRRHRSKKDKEETRAETVAEEEAMDVEKSNLENKRDGGTCVVTEVLVSGLAGVDYDMEEGEIVDHDGLLGGYIDNPKKNLDSDIESGEIKLNGYDDAIMGHNEEDVERVNEKSRKLGKNSLGGKEGREVDYERASASDVLANGDSSYKYHIDDDGLGFGDSKKTSGFDEVEGRIQTKSSSSEKRHIAVSGLHPRDKYLNVSSQRNLSKSPERFRARSRSNSILHEDSMGAPNKTDDLYYSERKHRRESNDERSIAHDNNYRHSSRDGARDKERERSSSRYTEQVVEQYGRDTHLKYRESSREMNLKRDRTVEKEREEERKRVRSRDRDRREKETDRLKERERDRDHIRESARGGNRDRDWDRKREDRNKDRERGGSRARSRDNDRDNLSDGLSRRQKYGNDEDSYRDWNNDSRHKRNSEDYQRERSRRSDLENISSKGNTEVRDDDNSKREIDGQEDYQERIELQLAEHDEEDDLERIKEESRRRRQAILEKYKNQPQKNGTQSQDIVKETGGQYSKPLPSADVNEKNTESQVESADIFVDEFTFSVSKSPLQNGLSTLKSFTGTGGVGDGTPKWEGCDDMFSDDIFGESPAEDRKMAKGDDVAVEKSGFHDNWDDAEGYYGYRFGETLDRRYEIIAAHGKGVFSTVVRAKDLKAKPGHPEEVAIKIIRNNETMYKAGMDERVILKKLVGADPENKRHCVRFLSTFKYRNHLCLVFESLNMDLRDVLKKFGRNIGLKLTAVRVYAKQLFIALKHLRNCGVLHCDIKPDNMLVNETKNVLKLCDFGNAMFAGKNEITPYLVSRFYRAPEIILGLPYDHPMDMWSVGCCLFELYTGKVLFPGATNNDMLRLHMELKGPFPKKMLRKGAFTDQHFDQDLNFLATEEDPVTKKAIKRLIMNIKPKDFGTLISGSSSEDPKMLSDFKDLMEKLFVLDPDKRLNVSQALNHPFFTGK